MKKPKDWFDKNERLNKDHVLKVGDRLYHQGLDYQKTDEPWIVVEIDALPPEEISISDHGFILIKREAYTSPYDDPSDDPLRNDNYEDYCFLDWQRYFRIIPDEFVAP